MQELKFHVVQCSVLGMAVSTINRNKSSNTYLILKWSWSVKLCK